MAQIKKPQTKKPNNFKGNNNFAPKPKVEKKPLVYRTQMTVSEIAEETNISVSEIIKTLMMMGTLANQTQSIDQDTAELLANELHVEFKLDESKDYTKFETIEVVDDPSDLLPRPPVVTIMGHVDHGKTTLLDTIRHTRVVMSEAGGITQQIGAYQVELNGKQITFIDTPGHAAFTAMRARGAQITDIIILVVAADDGVMPQTREAIDHAKAAGCPIIVAVNKMDKPSANPDRVKQELADLGVMCEEWGGNVPFVNISALRGTNVDTLLETILVLAELEEYKANPNRDGMGSVIESRLDKGKGPVATLLVKNGSLNVGDTLVVGNTYGKIRLMTNDLGKVIKTATPSMAVSVVGLQDVPQAGDQFLVFKEERKARQIAEIRAERAIAEERGNSKAMSLDELFAKVSEGETKTLRIVIKGDTNGSVEALKGSLEKIEVEGCTVDVIRASVGTITDTDVLLAQASNAIIMGFNVRPLANVKDDAKNKNVEIRLYDIIYKAIEDVEKAMKGMLDPVFEESVQGQAEVREIYKVSKVGTIGGCLVTSGLIRRDSLIKVIRDGIVIYEGNLGSLRRFKDDVKEVKQGFDCGLSIEKFNDIKVGDIIEASVMKEVPNE